LYVHYYEQFKVTAYVNNSLTFCRLASSVWFLFSTDCLSPSFHLNCTKVM